MGTNFNVGSMNAINTNPETKKSSKKDDKNNDLKKKLLLFGGIIVGGFLLLFLVMFLVSAFSTKQYSYDDMEEIMKKAAVQYFKANKDKLPANENQMVEIDVATLAANEYMKEMVEYTGEELTCTGKVSVQTNGEDYLYVPHLDCGEEYVTQPFYKVVTEKTVTQGYGLYESNGSYVFRGEEVNNYLQLDQSLWRIVKVTDDHKMLLISDVKSFEGRPWDNRYNQSVNYNAGINEYSASRMRTYLDEYYDTNEENKAILSDKDRARLTKFDLCIGKRDVADGSKDNSVECSQTLANQKIGLLTVADYINASIDSACTASTSYSCQNYNYLVKDYRWWLATAVNGSTSQAFGVDTNGVVEVLQSSNFSQMRPIVMLSESVLFKSGKGTLKKPYKIK